MNLLMLCRAPWLYSCQRLKCAAEQLGHHLDILDPNRFLLKLEQHSPQFSLYYQTDGQKKASLIPQYDGVIPRFGAASTQMGCFVLSQFEALGIPCLNQAQAVSLARHKWQSLQQLQSANLPIPLSLFAGSDVNWANANHLLPVPTVLKTLQGMQGEGVFLANNPEQAISLFTQHAPMLAQTFVQQAQGRDIRCFIIGERVVASMQRQARSGEFRANCHLGGEAQPIALTDDTKQLALRAAHTLGLDVAGVDLIPNEKGFLILEVNASPGLEMIEKTSGIDIALEMLLYFESQITKLKKQPKFHRTFIKS